MKIYIASSFNLIPKIKDIIKQLEENGHEITVRWWERIELKIKFGPLSPEEFYSEPECEYAYRRDRDGIKEADVFLFVADDEIRKYNGANIELGMADAWGKPCLSIGVLENSALYFGVIKCKNMNEVLTHLNDIDVAIKIVEAFP